MFPWYSVINFTKVNQNVFEVIQTCSKYLPIPYFLYLFLTESKVRWITLSFCLKLNLISKVIQRCHTRYQWKSLRSKMSQIKISFIFILFQTFMDYNVKDYYIHVLFLESDCTNNSILDPQHVWGHMVCRFLLRAPLSCLFDKAIDAFREVLFITSEERKLMVKWC